MSIPLIDREDVLISWKSKSDKSSDYKEIKEIVKNQKYKTFSIKHDLELNKFFWDYNEALNSVIHDIWDSITWKEVAIKKDKDKNGKKKPDYYRYGQKRLYPNYKKDKEFKKELRYKYLNGWKYSAHWINSVIDVAYSILDSWKKNYNKGKRKRNCPIAKRLFVRVKQTLMKIYKDVEKDKLRISIFPRRFVYIDLTKRYFKLNGRIGEPILTPTHIHLPIGQHDEKIEDVDEKDEKIKIPVRKIAWDLNKFSMDGFCPELNWIRIDLKPLHTAHISYDNKRRRINKIGSTKKIVGKRLKSKYSKREKNRCGQIVHRITNQAKEIAIKHGFEDFDKDKLFIRRGRRTKKWNKELGHINWKDVTRQMEYKSDIEFVDHENSSKECSRCGCVNRDLKGIVFRCVNNDCGLIIDRQHNAAIVLYSRMEGLSQDISSKQEWFDENVLSEFTQTGAECATEMVGTARKETDELVRSLYDLMKPQFYEDINI